VVVITKDVWSLRLNWNIEAYDTTLTKLVLQPAETNLARHAHDPRGLVT